MAPSTGGAGPDPMGTMGCFSFIRPSLGACGEGGATRQRSGLARQIRMLRIGRSREHVHQLKGGNYRMDGLQVRSCELSWLTWRPGTGPSRGERPATTKACRTPTS